MHVHRHLLGQHPDLRLVLIGDGEWRQRVVAWCRAEPRMSWQPYLSSPDALAAALSAADVFVHAGQNETFGLSVLEAQACGCPVVAGRESGLEDTVLPLPANACVPFGATAAWGEAILAALDAHSPALAAHRHASVHAHLPAEQTFARLHALYTRLRGAGATRLAR